MPEIEFNKAGYKNIRGIYFDLGYTLIEFKKCSWPDIDFNGQKLAYEKLLKHLPDMVNFDSFHDRYDELKEKTRAAAAETVSGWDIRSIPKTLLQQLQIPDAENLGRKFIEICYAYTRDQMYVEDGVLSTLKFLKNRNLKMGIISNTVFPAYLHDIDLDNFGMLPYLDYRLYSCDHNKRKPHPDIFKAAIEAMELAPEQIAYVGDRFKTDILGSGAVGMLPILKNCPPRKYPDPLPDGLPFINKISELTQVLMISE